MRFIQSFRMGCNWNWHLIPFHLIVCVVYRVRPCPLYRVISWLSKHIHSIQALGEMSLWDPLSFHSPPFFCISFFWTALLRPVFKCPPPSSKWFSFLHSSFCHSASLLYLFELEEGWEAGVFLFVFDFWDSHEIRYKPLMSRSDGVKKTTCSLLCAHRGFNIPMAKSLWVYCVCV